jgi:hypothetical protein
MLASFVVYNQNIFGRKARPVPVPLALTAPDGTMHADR